jgi:response regulator RpfG family c-di-GMP phosphodiesterase
LLHDIGKLAVPEYILNKPGKLTEAEFAKMKIHPTSAATFSSASTSLTRSKTSFVITTRSGTAAVIPKGLKGEGIPLVARIISVVDFYDATRCDRPYRKGNEARRVAGAAAQHGRQCVRSEGGRKFIKHVEEFDRLIDSQDIQEQVASETPAMIPDEHEA